MPPLPPRHALTRILTRPSTPTHLPPRLTMSKSTHPDFKTAEAARPPYDKTTTFHLTQTANPTWTPGSGSNSPPTTTPHIAIDPYEPGRTATLNYKLLISAITPRPIALLSTRSSLDGSTNLAPFSYFSLAGHDPPLFTVSFSHAGDASAKDTLRNLVDTKECVINIISEPFAEAANSCAVDAPHGVSEWDVAGLTPADCEDVGVKRVEEAVFAVEGRLESVREFESKGTPGKKTHVIAIIEGTRFWVRGDAVNAERSIVDQEVLRPISRLGGIMYGRTTEGFEIQRPSFEKDIGGMEGHGKLESKISDDKSDE